MKKVIALFTSLAAVLSGCGTSSSSSVIGPTSIASLPRATGAVSSSSTALSARNETNLFSATTGVILKEATTATFAGKSRAFCETAQTVKNLIREAAKNDKIACYVGAMETAGAFTSSYDGNYKYYSLTGAGEDGALKIKFKATRDADGVVSLFQMFTCEGASQTEYLNTSISAGTASLVAVGRHTHEGEGATFTGAHRVTVSGNYASGGWTGSKTIVGEGTFAMSGGAFTFTDNRYASMVQSATTVTLQGSNSHTFNDGSAHTGSGLVYAIIQGLNMGDVGTFALGDGTGKATFVFDSNENNGEASWNGDTLLNLGDVTTGDYYAQVHAATLPTATTPSPGLTSDESWNCEAQGAFTSINFEALQSNAVFMVDFAACNNTYGEDFGNSFIDCPHSGD